MHLCGRSLLLGNGSLTRLMSSAGFTTVDIFVCVAAGLMLCRILCFALVLTTERGFDMVGSVLTSLVMLATPWVKTPLLDGPVKKMNEGLVSKDSEELHLINLH